MRADEYLVEEIIKLKGENEELKSEISKLQSLLLDAIRERKDAEIDYKQLIENLKKDFEIEFKGQSMNGKSFFVWYGDDNFEYYKDVFGFNKQQDVEEGEKEDEI